MIFFYLLSMFGLTFAITQTGGLASWIRHKLISTPYIGVFFYHLFDCPFCTGCHSGWMVYLLAKHGVYYWQDFIIWSLAGGAISLLLMRLINKLHV